MKRYLSAVVIILLFTSCTKETTDETDTVKPVIQIVYPTDNPVIPAGDPLCMKVLISDDKSLMNVWLQVSDGYGFKKDYTVPGRSLEIIEKYVAPLNVKGNMIAKFSAMDDAGNVSWEEIKFAVNN